MPFINFDQVASFYGCVELHYNIEMLDSLLIASYVHVCTQIDSVVIVATMCVHTLIIVTGLTNLYVSL